MQIFDRWGNQIFYTEDINEGWGGLIDGQEYISNKRQSDVFVYYIYVKKISGRNNEYIGNITILK
jgi:hypothetical protein